LRLSLYTDYSCRVLIYLATTESNKCSIAEIALAFNASKNHLVKVVHHLGKLGFIETTRGRNGGISLSRPPEQISIGDVIRKTEPSSDLVECFNLETATCPIISSCGLKPWLAKANHAFFEALMNVTVADVTRNRQKLSISLGITANKP
jgi:Rrf2 family nitric oxide-sensitive transcriptional repressor